MNEQGTTIGRMSGSEPHLSNVPQGNAVETASVKDVHEDDLKLAYLTWQFKKAYDELAAVILDDNVKKGFWPKNKESRNVGEMLMLVTSELSEGLEGHRKDLKDDHLPDRPMLEVELADAMIRLMDIGAGRNLDVAGALGEKLAYNRKRPFKHGKNY